MEATKTKVFISYSHHNREICSKIAEVMEHTGGISVWYDKGLIPGEEYRKKIAAAIRSADFFLVLLSEKSVCSDWVVDEVEYAKKLRRKILPIWIEKVQLPENLDMILQRYHSLFWYLRTSDREFETALMASLLQRPEKEAGRSLLGNGNEFSEAENRKMRELLAQEAQDSFRVCYEPENAVCLGQAYLYGGPCAVDREKARFYFRIAEYFGNQDGTFYLLAMSLEDVVRNTWDEPEESFSAPIIERIMELADGGCVPARIFLGNMYWHGLYGYPADPVKSAQLYEACAKEGNARAQYIMASNYYFGDGVARDYTLAKMYANLAIEQHYLKGWRRWGKFYRDGLAVPRDYAKARECYEKGARMGDYNCFNKIGDMLYYGWGFPVDYREAVAYYLKGEAAPSFSQQFSLHKAKEALGRCYEYGHGVEKDLITAAEKYREGYRYGSEACKLGYLRCRNLAEMPEVEQSEIQEAVERIRGMEACLDSLQTAVNQDPTAISADDAHKECLKRLIDYYQSGQWLRDYELDEKGLLPQTLKRGILAQDTLYDFLDKVGDFAEAPDL